MLSLIVMSFMLCSYNPNNNVTVKGYIHSYGNVPFNFIGIKTNNKKEYAISASEDEIKRIWKTQGHEIEITGIIISKKSDGPELGMLKDGKIEVIEWKYVE